MKIYPIDGRLDFVARLQTAYRDLENVIVFNEKPVTADTKLQIKKFSDGEITADFKEPVRGESVFLVGSTNTSDNIISMIMAADAARRASAKEIIAVIPYFGYSRQDKKDDLRGPIGARVIADTLTAAGIDRIITVDLHASQIQGFFKIPVDHINGHHIFLSKVEHMLSQGELQEMTICSPDAGGVKRAEKYWKYLTDRGYDVDFAMINKKRVKANEIDTMDLVGNVKSRDVIIIDDMVDTAGTLCKAANLLVENGAKSVRAICTHGILSGPAFERIENSEALTKLLTTDSVPHSTKDLFDKIEIVDMSMILAKIMIAITRGISAHQLINAEE